MPKKSGIVFVIAGAVLMLSALSLFLYNWLENAKAGQESINLLSEIQAEIEENTPPTLSAETEVRDSSPQETKPAETLDPELPVTEINGYGYVGYLSIPDLGLELPVMAEWDYDRLKISPCRQHGSSRTDDLVIAAHNYKTHFGNLSALEQGAVIVFTDMDGVQNTYEVEVTDVLAPTEVETVLNSDYDLVLYTCTVGGRTRVTVFCNRQEAASSAPDTAPVK